jgi:fructan beta-fructosidase
MISYRQNRREFLKVAGLGTASLGLFKSLSVPQSGIGEDNQIPYYDEPFRPQFHLTPTYGWMNDPCGLFYYRGEYHIHYQANPGNPKGWGSQWSHAFSNDLVRWKNLPPSLVQDEKYGGCSTGSCVVDWNNTSGFQTGKENVIVLVFTITNPDQKQGVAYSNDGGRSWKRYPGNPVIVSTDGNKDFRDPKVFWHEPLQKWIMVASRGYTAPGDIFKSSDLKKWEHLGKAPNGECPDMFELFLPGSLNKKWLYLCGDYPMARNGTGAKYFIGNFDGRNFHAESGQFRLGGNFFVGQSFGDIRSSDNRRIYMGWKWLSDEADFGPWTGGFQTIPVELNLMETEKNIVQLNYRPVKELQSLRQKHFRINKKVIDKSSTLLEEQKISGELIECIAEFQLDSAMEFGFLIRKGSKGASMLVYHVMDKKIVFSDAEGKEKFSQSLSPQNGILKLHLLIDRSVIDVFGNDGITWNCGFFKADPKDKGIELYAKEGTVNLLSFDCWQLKSIFD